MPILTDIVKEVKNTVHYRKQYTKVQKRLDRKAPKTGDLAPDFTLASVDGTETVTLSQFRRKKPVVLVFGSFT